MPFDDTKKIPRRPGDPFERDAQQIPTEGVSLEAIMATAEVSSWRCRCASGTTAQL